jgi:hypothetical protein
MSIRPKTGAAADGFGEIVNKIFRVEAVRPPKRLDPQQLSLSERVLGNG